MVHGRRYHTCADHPGTASTISDELIELPHNCLEGNIPTAHKRDLWHSGVKSPQDTSGRCWWAALEPVTTRSQGSWKAAWIWLVRFQEGSTMFVTGMVYWQEKPQHGSSAITPGQQDMTSGVFLVATVAQPPAEASPKCSSDLWCRYHHFSFFRQIISLGSQHWCHPSGFLLQGIWGYPALSFAGHQGLWTLWKFPFNWGQRPSATLCESLSG